MVKQDRRVPPGCPHGHEAISTQRGSSAGVYVSTVGLSVCGEGSPKTNLKGRAAWLVPLQRVAQHSTSQQSGKPPDGRRGAKRPR
jgi:hypothetical protein